MFNYEIYFLFHFFQVIQNNIKKMEALSDVNLASEEQNVATAPRLQRQCKIKRMNDTYAELEVDEEYGASASAHATNSEDMFKVPIVQNKAEERQLNFPMQYKRLVKCCDRDVYKIHDKEPGCTDESIKGSSVDKR